MGEKARGNKQQRAFLLSKALRYLLLWSGTWSLARFASSQPRYWGSWAEIRLTENCNSRCLTCNAWKNKSTNELTLAEFDDVFKQLRELGAPNVTISGGEALVRPDAIDIIRKAKSTGFKGIMLKTNGLLLEKKAADLANCGLTHLMVSIDGMHEVDNFVRGVPNHFERATDGIRAFNKLKEEANSDVKVVIMTTLLGLNAADVPELIKTCSDLNASWNMNLLDCNMDLFKDIDIAKLRFTSRDMIESFFVALREQQKKYPSVAHFCNYELDYAKNFLNGEAENPPCVNGYQGICIGANGEVYSNCFVLPSVGNLRENSLRQIIDSDLYRKRLSRMYRRQCPGCTYYWPENVVAKHIFSHSLICGRFSAIRKAGRARRKDS
ncbi:MAG TPA: radical SAM protein [Candidatus Binatia bacterium]|nr:radical SAM protein [Candidatus Binatia bacterium]